MAIELMLMLALGKLTVCYWKWFHWVGWFTYSILFKMVIFHSKFLVYQRVMIIRSMDWFKGKSTGNHRFSHEIWGFPAIFPVKTNPLIRSHLPAIPLKMASSRCVRFLPVKWSWPRRFKGLGATWVCILLYGFVWKWLVPLNPMVNDHYPY